VRVETEGERPVARQVRGRLATETHGQGFTDLTPAVLAWLQAIGAGEGLLAAWSLHTTASLVVQENADRDVRRDLLDALSRLAPERGDYRHALEGPDDMPGHIKAALLSPSVTIPVAEGALALGQWQALYLAEHRHTPHRRTIRLLYVGD
jgi:secondary thiamine-phosphate synthase enzyme